MGSPHGPKVDKVLGVCLAVLIWGFPKIKGTFLGVPNSIFGSILGYPPI